MISHQPSEDARREGRTGPLEALKEEYRRPYLRLPEENRLTTLCRSVTQANMPSAHLRKRRTQTYIPKTKRGRRTKHVATRAPVSLVAALRKLARAQKRTLSQVMLFALREYVAKASESAIAAPPADGSAVLDRGGLEVGETF